MGHQSYVLLCTETTLYNHPVVIFWVKYQKLWNVEIIWIPVSSILEKINKNCDRKYFLGYHDALKIYGAPKLCTFMYDIMYHISFREMTLRFVSGVHLHQMPFW